MSFDKAAKRKTGQTNPNESSQVISTVENFIEIKREAGEPEGLFKQRLKYSNLLRHGPSSAIRKDCFECMGGSWKAVAECVSAHCHQWLFRFGYDPRRKKRLSEAERQIRSERAKKNFGMLKKLTDTPSKKENRYDT